MTALSVDPDGKKIACHGYSATNLTSKTGYIFVLDASSGALASGLV